MNKDSHEIEQRMVNILRRNSRASILDLAEELGISRITASKTLTNLIDSGKISNFTVFTKEDEKDLAILHLLSLDGMPEDAIIEHFELLDGSFIAVIYYETLPGLSGVNVLDLKFALARKITNSYGRIMNIQCDYCGKKMEKPSVVFQLNGKTMYACCTNCEGDLRRRDVRN